MITSIYPGREYSYDTIQEAFDFIRLFENDGKIVPKKKIISISPVSKLDREIKAYQRFYERI